MIFCWWCYTVLFCALLTAPVVLLAVHFRSVLWCVHLISWFLWKKYFKETLNFIAARVFSILRFKCFAGLDCQRCSCCWCFVFVVLFSPSRRMLAIFHFYWLCCLFLVVGRAKCVASGTCNVQQNLICFFWNKNKAIILLFRLLYGFNYLHESNLLTAFHYLICMQTG